MSEAPNANSNTNITAGEIVVLPTYEPPRIESVYTADDLDREVLYAGVSGI